MVWTLLMNLVQGLTNTGVRVITWVGVLYEINHTPFSQGLCIHPPASP